jgi:Uma2 family endonuclease
VAELIAGVLYTHPRPAPRHARAHGRLLHRLGPPYDEGQGGPGGWVILIEPEVHLGDARAPDVLVPDLGGWRRESMPELPDVPFFELAPDWVCEIVSPSTEAVDRGAKMSAYGRHGVKHAWLVDPLERTLEAYENDHDRWHPLGQWRADARARVVPFEGVELDLAALWAR